VIWEKVAAERLKVIEKQQKEIDELKRLVKELSEKIARLEKNSTNSSKPPSSDIIKASQPEAAANGQKRKQGAQKGHKKHERTPFPPEQIDKTILHQSGRRLPIIWAAVLPHHRAYRSVHGGSMD
jgi:hypothetical protein